MFLCLNRILRSEEGYYRSEISDWWYSNVPGTILKNCPSKNWEIWHFFSSVPIFLPVALKSATLHPNKTYLFEISKIRAIISQSLTVLSLKLHHDRYLKMGCCFSQIMPNDSQNHLNNKWLPWKQNKDI